MKKILFILILCLMSLPQVFATDDILGKWEFRNIFSQTIIPGSVSFEPLDIIIIKSLELTNKAIYPDRDFLKEASISILGADDLYHTSKAVYIINNNCIIISINNSETEKFFINFIPETNDMYWYSYAISIDGVRDGLFIGPSEESTQMMSLIGMMIRVE